MYHSKAIVTLAVGERYERLFENICRDSWTVYAERFGYDLIVIKEALDNSERARRRSPAWQKLLILSQDWSDRYGRVVWVDTDIIMNPVHAKDICENTPEHHVGTVEAFSIPTPEISQIALDRITRFWEAKGVPHLQGHSPQQYYRNRGIEPGNIDKVVQTGVFTCSPRHHKELFEHIYNSYEDTYGPEWNYEMPAMSFELLRNNQVTWISSRFNFVVYVLIAAFYPQLLESRKEKRRSLTSKVSKKLGLRRPATSDALERALQNIYDLSIFCHFAGCSHWMSPLSAALSRPR